jgi:hypothetical protein
MRTRLLVAPLLIIALFMAGCADSAPKTVASSSATSAAPATVTADTGGIEGTVTDDELRPIMNAEVAIVSTGAATKTDTAGKFSFSELPAGSVKILVQRLGFESTGKKVDVVAGEITSVSIAMTPFAIIEVVPELLIYKGYIKLGTALTAAAEGDSGVVLGCEKCLNKFTAPKDVQTVVFEALFKSTLPDPREMKIYTQTRADDKLLINSDWADRQKFELKKDWSKGAFEQFLACGNVSLSICYEQPFEIYTTLFHNGEAPEDYTGLPPA